MVSRWRSTFQESEKRLYVVGRTLVLEWGEVDSSARSASSDWVTLSKALNLDLISTSRLNSCLSPLGSDVP